MKTSKTFINTKHLNIKGFTLIELMIVIAIIAILAAIAIPAYQNYVIRAQIAEGMVLMDGAKVAVWDYYANDGVLPADNSAAGLNAPTSIIGTYVTSLTLTNGVVDITYGNKVNQSINGANLIFTPTANKSSIVWVCTSPDIPAKYLPTGCR